MVRLVTMTGGNGEALRCAARREPERTLSRCRAELSETADAAARIRLRHAMALAHAEHRELPAATAQLSAAIREARRSKVPDQLGELHLTAAWIRLDGQDPRGCLTELRRARPLLDRAGSARARCLRGTAQHVLGNHAAAAGELDMAVRELRSSGDSHWLANALNARACTNGYHTDPGTAELDLVTAEALFEALGEQRRAAYCRHNRGFVALRRGDLSRALRLFARAERAGAAGELCPEIMADQAQALLDVGLVTEAQAAAERAVAALAVAGRGPKLAEAALAVSDCAARAGDPETACLAAAHAAKLFRHQGRTAWAVAAHARQVTARLADGEPRPQWRRAGYRAIARCDRYGWPVLAARLRLALARDARSDAARRLLEPVAAMRSARATEPAVLGWIARAALQDGRAATAAARAGLRRLGGDTVWGAGNAAHWDLAELGLRTAMAGGNPRAVLTWIDRQRAADTPRDAAQPGEDTMLDAAASTAPCREPGHRERPALDCRELATALGDSAMVAFAVQAGRVHAVSVVSGKFRLHRLCDAAEVAAVAGSLRLAARPPVAESHASQLAAQLDRLLLAPIAGLLGDRPLVLVPPPEIAAVPWPRLPSLRGRELSLAPSPSGWLRASSDGTSTCRRALWAAGPDLAYAPCEVAGLATRGDVTLTGARATVAAVLAAVDGAGTAHLAAHGRFHQGSPLLSSLRFSDGLLYAYQLGTLRTPPKLLVLSACESGQLGPCPSGGLAGLATALLASGTSAVVGSTLPVPDGTVSPLMHGFHAGLRAGLGPARALADAQEIHGDLGFLCIGAG